jgi:Fe-S cluster assembly ATP-binding protein
MQNKEGVYSRMGADLAIQNLHVCVEGQEILRGARLGDQQGRDPCHHGPQWVGQEHPGQHAHGPSGLRGDRGEILVQGPELVGMSPDERSRLGLFLAFQYPSAIPGVSVANFLRTAINARRARGAPASNGPWRYVWVLPARVPESAQGKDGLLARWTAALRAAT